jgi:chemotaxis protein MotB
MKAKAKQPEEEPKMESAGGMRWLLTYSDMITLLLAFFIILYALSNIQKNKYEALVQALRAAFNGHQITVTKVQTHKRAPYPLHNQAHQNTGTTQADKLYNELQNILQKDGVANEITITKLPYGVNMIFLNGILFQEGQADLDAQALKPLTDIGQVLQAIPNAIVIQGYADDLPINTPVYHSNWDLSAMRAARVADYWMSKGIAPTRMMLEGFGQWSPFASNATEAGRAQNRAVSVVVLNENFVLRNTTVGSPSALPQPASAP